MGISFVLGIKEFIMGWLSIIPKLMYFLCATFMSLLDGMQLVVRKLAGLDVYYVDGVAQEGDIALSFIKSIFYENSSYPALKNAFWALVIFAVLLLIVATIIAIIRQEYMPAGDDLKDKPNNTKTHIVGKFIKGLFLFLIVPVSCVFGLYILDVILVSVDGVLNNSIVTTTSVMSDVQNLDSKIQSHSTTNGKQTYISYDIFGDDVACTSITFSGTMFKAAAFSANRIRMGEVYDGKTFAEGLFTGEITNFGLFTLTDIDANAELVDIAFASNFKLKNEITVNVGYMEDIVSSGPFWKLETGDSVTAFSKYNIGLVFYFYDLWYFNFIIAFALFIICIKIFFNLIIGLMKRIIEMVGLFIISPPIIATFPLDGGKAFTKWREEFLKKALSAVAAITGLNLLFIILPYLNVIKLFDFEILNYIMSSLFIIVGLVTAETLIAMMSKIVGADDVNKAGADFSAKVGQNIASAATTFAGVAGFALKLHPAGAALNAGAKMAATGAKKVGKKIANSKKYKNFQGKAFTSEKDKENAQKQAEKDFYNGESEKEFDKKVESEVANDKAYQQKVDEGWEKYQKRKTSTKSKEEWMKSSSKMKKLRQEAVDRATNKITGGMSKQDYIIKNKDNFINNRKQTILNDLGKKQQKAIIKDKARKIARVTGLANINAYGSLYFGNVKSAFVRGGKGGLKSMAMAFAGVDLKTMQQNEKLAEMQKDEEAKFINAQKQREKIRKK